MSMKGFTLIETLVAVTILMLAIAGPLSAANSALVSARVSHDQIIASYLAQEGIEYVRSVRDSAYLSAYDTGDTSGAWNDFLTVAAVCRATASTPTKACSFDSIQATVSSCPSGVCPMLYLETIGGVNYYTTAAGSVATPFRRSIQIKDVLDGSGAVVQNDKQIVSVVTWSFHTIPHTVTVTDHLTPWE